MKARYRSRLETSLQTAHQSIQHCAAAPGVVASAALLLVACTPSRVTPVEPLSTESSLASSASDSPGTSPRALHTYYTGGVHNDVGCVPASKCVYPRAPGQPTNPEYPAWWSSEWTMYRVFEGYEQFPPPYASPPAGLTSDDYEVSYGATYYDSSYVPPDGDGNGAMMEHYDKRCLPIFPSSNDYTCSFVSLGNKAYFLRYADRPSDTPPCCQFSLDNHPPRRDFIEHLPYDEKQSAHLDGSIQAYSMLVPPGILFGYAFYAKATVDSVGSAAGADSSAVAYRHPQSFFFSGSPTNPPNAPIVSQNYTNFRRQKPAPESTWNQVAEMCPKDPPWCCLFETDCPSASRATAAPGAAGKSNGPSWGDLAR